MSDHFIDALTAASGAKPYAENVFLLPKHKKESTVAVLSRSVIFCLYRPANLLPLRPSFIASDAAISSSPFSFPTSRIMNVVIDK
ncbi:hypothetical protein MJ390_16120 [Klebsiella pneumoniae]|nr:hypothetical protein MJ390_16120 [Klebsiella pneumoniae]